MKTKLNSLIDYLSFLIKKYHDLLQNQHQLHDAFRIIDIQHNKAEECIVSVQIIGKATVIKCSAQELVKNDTLLEGFSKKDIRTLTYFASQEIKKHKYHILVQEFSDKFDKIVFKLGIRGKQCTIEKTADQITLDKSLLQELNPEDAHLIGYTTATEQLLREKKEMELLSLGNKATDK